MTNVDMCGYMWIDPPGAGEADQPPQPRPNTAREW